MKVSYIIKYVMLLLLIITLIYILYTFKEGFDNTIYDCVISINVHENVTFLIKQLNNIKENVKCNYVVVLNCNEFMYNECKNIDFSENVYINDEIINKRRMHGSLTNGIYSNMQLSLNKFKFNYFIISSSRNMFDNNMTLNDLNKVTNLGQYIHENQEYMHKNNSYTDWHWPNLIETLLAKYFLNKNKKLYSSPHEGLMFSYNGCNKIVEFLEENQDIKSDLFNFNGCVEEFSLQTISANYGEPYYYIGNGCCNENKLVLNTETDINFMYKVSREGFSLL